MIYDNLAIVDLETTGMSGTRDRIIEIAILRVEKNKIVEEFTTLVNPQTYVSPFIQRLTGISGEELIDAPVFSQVKNKVLDMLSGTTFVAHNARFDYSFMRSELQRLKTLFNPPALCTVRLSRRLFPRYKRHGLEAIIERFDFSYEKRHRAYDDANILWQFLRMIKKDVPKKKLIPTWNALLTQEVELIKKKRVVTQKRSFYLLKKITVKGRLLFKIEETNSLHHSHYQTIVGIFMDKPSAKRHLTTLLD